jgi:asparagine synthase (glutamine-hydrolysing)
VSGIVAVLGAPGASEESAARSMLGRIGPRGGDQSQWWSGEGGLVGLSRSGWELSADFAGGVLVLEEKQLVVAADASLYYRDELGRALRGAGVRPSGDSPSHLIAAAYRAWGAALVDVLEGDFAFLLWDRQRRQVVAARDFAGSRPLYFARAGDRLVVASTPAAVAAHPAVSSALNPLAIAEDLIGASSMAVRETAFRAVERLPAGSRLLWQPGSSPRVEGFWQPPRFERDEGPGTAEAAEQLRAVLRAAVRERLATDGPTAVWMSGGYDSPAIFALALGARGQGARGSVIPVSMSYPKGDPGREDELIEAVGAHLDAKIHWVSSASLTGLPEPRCWAARRDEPFAHPYESWNLALASGSRETGARVILGGNGGDQFFGVSPVFLADLARAGRWGDLWAEASEIGLGRHNYRDLFHWAVQPVLPGPLLDLARRVRGGRPLRAHLQAPIPGWLRLDQATVEALWQRQWHYGLRRPEETFGSAETAWYLQSSFGQRIASTLGGFLQEAGVEARSPMYDRRVIEYMARRPREERFARGETKRLLRRAMFGLLPEAHLAPRKTRTGLPSAYLHQARVAALPLWAEAAGSNLRLAELGLVTVGGLRTALDRYLRNPEWEGKLGGQLFNLFSAEFWIRVHTEADVRAAELVA